jgi:hypothetical protein
MITQALLAALAAKLLATPPRPRAESTTIVSSPVTCVAFTRRDLHSRRFHAFVCVDVENSGDVTGGILRNNGSLVCDLDGVYDGRCVTLQGCGFSQQSCS